MKSTRIGAVLACIVMLSAMLGLSAQIGARALVPQTACPLMGSSDQSTDCGAMSLPSRSCTVACSLAVVPAIPMIPLAAQSSGPPSVGSWTDHFRASVAIAPEPLPPRMPAQA